MIEENMKEEKNELWIERVQVKTDNTHNTACISTVCQAAHVAGAHKDRELRLQG